jgi:hypothetical protein
MQLQHAVCFGSARLLPSRKLENDTHREYAAQQRLRPPVAASSHENSAEMEKVVCAQLRKTLFGPFRREP